MTDRHPFGRRVVVKYANRKEEFLSHIVFRVRKDGEGLIVAAIGTTHKGRIGAVFVRFKP